MSTITLDYPNSTQLRRGSSLRWLIVLIISLTLIVGVILVAASSAKADSSSGVLLPSVVTIPVPLAPVVNSQVLPVATSTPAPSPAVIAVPVPTPPSQ